MGKSTLSDLQSYTSLAQILFVPVTSRYYNKYHLRILFVECTPEEIEAIKEATSAFNEDEFSLRVVSKLCTFYSTNIDDVLTLCQKFTSIIQGVFGPPTEDFNQLIKNLPSNTIVQNKLYHGKFRYRICYLDDDKYLDDCYPILKPILESFDEDSWTGYRVDASANRRSYINANPGYAMFPASYGPRNVIVYLTELEDYVQLKLMTMEYIKISQEVVLVEEICRKT